jgi:hypothetical protein
MVKFSYHEYDESGHDWCGYFVTMPCCQNPVYFCTPGADNNVELFLGIYNAFGIFSEVSHRQGFVTYFDPDVEFGI